jgi:hypothetical protein
MSACHNREIHAAVNMAFMARYKKVTALLVT